MVKTAIKCDRCGREADKRGQSYRLENEKEVHICYECVSEIRKVYEMREEWREFFRERRRALIGKDIVEDKLERTQKAIDCACVTMAYLYEDYINGRPLRISEIPCIKCRHFFNCGFELWELMETLKEMEFEDENVQLAKECVWAYLRPLTGYALNRRNPKEGFNMCDGCKHNSKCSHEHEKIQEPLKRLRDR